MAVPVTGKMMMIDTSRCIGCKACQVACQQWHSLPAEDTTFTGTYQNPPDMSGANLTVTKFTEVDTEKWLFFKDQCRHCDTPYCKDACPLGAIKRKANGIVFIKEELCDPSACHLECQLACPYGVATGIPKFGYTRDGAPVETKAMKCDFCYDRFKKNDDLKRITGKFAKSNRPACELTCPPAAIKSGSADKIWKTANRRVKKLKENGFPDANVYPSLPSHVVWVLAEKPQVYGQIS